MVRLSATRSRRSWLGTGLIALLLVGATVLSVLLVLNLTSSEKRLEHPIAPLYAAEDPAFIRIMSSLGPALLPGNRVQELSNGDEIFPAMLAAIRGAERTITFETYIYWSGAIGKQLAEALSERARAGVKVHVLLDAVGANRMDASLLSLMMEAGVEVERYHPVRWYSLDRVNNRTHRKLLIVDGRIGFTGGVGIADRWLGHAQDPDHWRDSHFRIEGPAVAQMQATFLENWLEARSELLLGDDYFPPLPPVGESLAQMIRGGVEDGSETVRLLYLLSIASARRSIRIASAYFVPDALAIETLLAARRRGVAVTLLVPGHHTDTHTVRRASRSLWGPLLAAGVALYEYQPTMLHAKVMVIDEIWTSVGSTNFDSRSFRLNDEANLNVWDATFARRQAALFEQDLARARRVTFEAWAARPRLEKLADWAASLIRAQL